MKEKLTRFEDLKVWKGNIPTWFRYTAGVAGETFLKSLRDHQKIMGTRCPKCDRVFVPPRMYCEECMEYTKDWVEIEGPGYVETFTVLYRDLEDQPLKEPKIVAFITWPGVEGGLIHEIRGVDPEEMVLDLPVAPVFKKDRKGSITDIEYFHPVE